MEVSVDHNEAKQTPFWENKFTNTCTNLKKQAVWKSITDKVNAVSTAQRSVTDVTIYIGVLFYNLNILLKD